jgi:hypothetical protein
MWEEILGIAKDCVNSLANRIFISRKLLKENELFTQYLQHRKAIDL